MRKKENRVKAWAMYIDAYYQVFVGVFEGVNGGKAPPRNHMLADWFKRMGYKVVWRECEIITSAKKKA